MIENLGHTAAIILAAGKGTRIGSHLPKVLYPLAGRPMVSYILNILDSIGLKDIYVVTGFRSEDVQASINRKAYFVHQPIALGTGHAVSCALNEIPPDIDTIIVVNGDDSSFYTPSTIQKIIEKHNSSKSVLSIVTAEIDSQFGLGRIIRDENGQIIAIREEKECSDAEKLIKEVNIGLYVFEADWIRLALAKIKPRPGQEIYLVDVIAIAHAELKKVNDIRLGKTSEWRGVNTKEELALANEKMISKMKIEINDKKIYLFDLDDTFLATNNLKLILEERALNILKNIFGVNLHESEIKAKFWDTYTKHKEINGWFSTPKFGEELATVFGIKEGGPTLKRLMYTLPFEQYIKEGVKDMLASLNGNGMRVVIAWGDLVYQPIKLSILNDSIDAYHTYEKVDETAISEIVNIYESSQIILTDDRLENLASFKKINQNITTIWIKDGPYKDNMSDDYKADFEVKNIEELDLLLKKI